jgi:Leu/Phe-tRNA-protein transferase
LISPTPGANLLLYVSVTETTVSVVLVQEQEINHSKYQVPVYYVSEALSGSKVYYYEIEKIAYTILTTSRKLKHYFQAHKIRVLINYPLKEVLQSCRTTGRLGKWAAKLSQHFIEF